ncbi:DUF6902 family protein [Thetidibacter halocola]|uniref:Uncharacterized protein n=1 Tax=Thetidibacter halocola TaxID=2827239 RepID=A0A8J7WCD4_9RHOB|nr:hypothetical protein [Thetidibacter halocola]MBS0122798.1 hypothetical protein [Thetidibacter halocola]
MGTVIQLSLPSRIAPMAERVSALIGLFATQRRVEDDVFWLKENAELLNILECTGISVDPASLAVHEGFYTRAEERLRFFPQYYRFILSLTLDIEALGMKGDAGERMAHFAADQGLADAELSDLQRAEARRLMMRRGIDPLNDPGLDDRLRAFAARDRTFALPNKKAAYELTHIAYYLSEYGRRDPRLPQSAVRSLHFAGLTAFLEQNADLLAEICIALIHAGETPPEIWTDWLGAQTRGFATESGPGVPLQDDYHEFFVCNWHAATVGAPVFRIPVAMERTRFDRAARPAPLREISLALMELEGARCGEWPVMRRRMAPHLSPETVDLIEIAAASSVHFDAFFEGFARAGAA